MTLKEKIIDLLKKQKGLEDREITNILFTKGYPQQSINQACRSLEKEGILNRIPELGKIRNYYVKDRPIIKKKNPQQKSIDNNYLSEDQIKKILENFLYNKGWATNIAWGRKSGPDIVAVRNTEKWIIEVKGCGSLNAMRVNYFLGVLGEILQRMDEEDAKYSIAFPDLKQFRNLWERFPSIAKRRTKITSLFIDSVGNIVEQK